MTEWLQPLPPLQVLHLPPLRPQALQEWPPLALCQVPCLLEPPPSPLRSSPATPSLKPHPRRQPQNRKEKA